MQKLKKQLAEKERALTAEQEALVAVQAKLREVRAELNSERSRLMQNVRSLEENLGIKQTELQAMIARNHSQSQKMQQVFYYIKFFFLYLFQITFAFFISDASSVK